MPESKYLYRNIKRKQRMIDNIQRYENDKNKKKEAEETMIFNTQIIDYIMNQTSILDTQANLTLNNSFNRHATKNLQNQKNNNIVSTKNKCQGPLNNKTQKDKNKKLQNQITNALGTNQLNQKNKYRGSDFINNNNNRKNTPNINNNDRTENFNIFEKFNTINNNKCNHQKNNANVKAITNQIKKDEENNISVEFLIDAIDKAEQFVAKNPQSHRNIIKMKDYLTVENIKNQPELNSCRENAANNLNNFDSELNSNDENKNNIKINSRELMNNNLNAHNFINGKSEIENIKNKISHLIDKNKEAVNDIKNTSNNNAATHNNPEFSQFDKQRRSLNSNLNFKQSFSKNKINQIENISTKITSEQGSSNLTVKDKVYLTRNEIILNNLLSKNSLNNNDKENINNQNKNLEKGSSTLKMISPIAQQHDRAKASNIKTEKIDVVLYDLNSLNKAEINSSSIKDINKIHNMNKPKEEENFEYFSKEILLNQMAQNQNEEVNNYLNEPQSENNSNKQRHRTLSRNQINFNSITSLNRSNEKNILAGDVNKMKESSSKNLIEANKITQPLSNIFADKNTNTNSNNVRTSTTYREKESALIINKLGNHIQNKIFNKNIKINTNNVIFNKTNFDIANKPKINSHRMTVENEINQKNTEFNKNNYNHLNSANNQNVALSSRKDNENHAFKSFVLSNGTSSNLNPNLNILSHNINTTENNKNNRVNIFSNSQADIYTNNTQFNNNFCDSEKKHINQNTIINNLGLTQNKVKVMLKGNILCKEAIKINSYNSKEGYNTYKNNLGKTNQIKMNTNTAREVIIVLIFDKFFIDLI